MVSLWKRRRIRAAAREGFSFRCTCCIHGLDLVSASTGLLDLVTFSEASTFAPVTATLPLVYYVVSSTGPLGCTCLSPAVSVESSSLQPGSAPSPNRRLLAPLRRIRWARFIPFRRSRLRHAGPRDRVPRPERTHARVNLSNRPWPSLRDLN